MCLGVDLLGFILFEILYDSWIRIHIFFLRLGKLSAIISLNKFSSFSLSSEIPKMLMFLYLMMAQRSLNQISVFIILFSFCSSAWWLSVTPPSRLLIHLPHLFNCCLFHLVYSFQSLYSSALTESLLFFPSVCEVLSSFTLSLSPMSVFVTITLNTLSSILLISVSFYSFSVVLSFSFTCHLLGSSSCLLICLIH